MGHKHNREPARLVGVLVQSREVRQLLLCRAAAIATMIFVGAVSTASCDSFGGGAPVLDIDAGGSGEGDSGIADVDTPEVGYVAIVADHCPPFKGGTNLTPPTERVLYSPTTPKAPFGIATDKTHVTWVEQEVTDAAVPTEALGTPARILRVAKAGGAPTVLARDQLAATAVAVDGAYAYWTTWDGTTSTLWRSPLTTNCDEGSCPPPEQLTAFSMDDRVRFIARYAAGQLVFTTEAGVVYLVELPVGAPQQILRTSASPSVTLTDTHLYAANFESTISYVQRSTVATPPEINAKLITLPGVDAGNGAVTHMSSDCTGLWMLRLTSSGRAVDFQPLDDAGLEHVTDISIATMQIVADSTHLWLASQNQGLAAVSHADGSSKVVHSGSVRRVAVDDDGVYFGDLNKSGALYMLLK